MITHRLKGKNYNQFNALGFKDANYIFLLYLMPSYRNTDCLCLFFQRNTKLKVSALTEGFVFTCIYMHVKRKIWILFSFFRNEYSNNCKTTQKKTKTKKSLQKI